MGLIVLLVIGRIIDNSVTYTQPCFWNENFMIPFAEIPTRFAVHIVDTNDVFSWLSFLTDILIITESDVIGFYVLLWGAL